MFSFALTHNIIMILYNRAGFANVEPYPYEIDENQQLKLDLVLSKLNQVQNPDKTVLILII